MDLREISDPVERVAAFLRNSGCDSKIFHTEETIFTVEDASKAVGAPPEEILKSLLFSLDDGAGWALALMSGSNKVHDKKVKRALDVRKAHMGTAEAIKRFSGFEPGGVPPVGYADPPRALLDEDLFKYSTVWAAAGSDHDFFPISPEDLLRITSGTRTDIKK
ncbi:MAG: YbaK/EbsC family protein [Synergistaceae bacterium]|jgi:prolyl-tRNA editing enzyme YbaK/EbsC (Cys-tRNA(Pro) deacylase)|nr:YbaK/EbsC family protein [Synergistaceae bacterium]